MTINFKPWIGDDYHSGSKIGLPCKLMLLGESHYGGRDGGREKFYPDFTKCVIREYVHGDWTHRYFTTLNTYTGTGRTVISRHYRKRSSVQRPIPNAYGNL